MTSGVEQAFKDYAHELGFSAAGIVPTSPSPQLDAYLRWLELGMHGSMGYMGRPDHVARRKDLNVILPGAKSLIVVAYDYRVDKPSPVLTDPARGRISSYAWGPDYHRVMMPRLKLLASMVESYAPEARSRAYVDTGAILERSHAEQAKMGFIGKNTMLIHPRRGSGFFLGEIITTLALDYGETIRKRMPGCGSCTRCLTACPTSAFAAPYVLDARRCISYLTIEHRGVIEADLRPLIGNWVYGCDICQEVCPWQRFAQPVDIPELEAVDIDHVAPRLETLLALTREQFEARYQGTAIHRIGRGKLVGNACIAAGNSGISTLSECLIPLLRDEDRVVRSHAAWAIGKLGRGSEALDMARLSEEDIEVRHEIETALGG